MCVGMRRCDSLSDDNDETRLLMPAGMFFVVIGGWLLSG